VLINPGAILRFGSWQSHRQNNQAYPLKSGKGNRPGDKTEQARSQSGGGIGFSVASDRSRMASGVPAALMVRKRPVC
jgi:hypothetical protein